jgi:hypothetical protein
MFTCLILKRGYAQAKGKEVGPESAEASPVPVRTPQEGSSKLAVVERIWHI